MVEINITASAITRMKAILSSEPSTSSIRLGIEGGGCSGLKYRVLISKEIHERDQVLELQDLKIVIDPKSYIYLKGVNVDYEQTLLRQGFVFSNPNAAKNCGCGTSFSI